MDIFGNSAIIRGMLFFFQDALLSLLKKRILIILNSNVEHRVMLNQKYGDPKNITLESEIRAIETARSEKLKQQQTALKSRGQISLPGLSGRTLNITQAAPAYFPPCMRERFKAIGTEPHLKNYGRLQVASFCFVLGIPQDVTLRGSSPGELVTPEQRKRSSNK